MEADDREFVAILKGAKGVYTIMNIYEARVNPGLGLR
jgi:hypothetical protein